ncbi:major tail protein [Bacillus sonorensis]|uniref:major tail protein n=1 Tax=Bacillus sonorensis TaxID=119858 RepID=UPI00227FE271|nr:major tail protein [Bacillus sonorensis]MCY8025661.1 phage tail protein [Bacillus sonorensis]MCY8087601.1 phage tail protein [Bacillus sonorensis]MCY8271449.1 phage tail protein [Bacillus sonorensis]MCY8603985.1 phage tail protein [Bacillus sonorensis]
MPKHSSVTGLKGVRFAPLKEVDGLYVASKIIDYQYAINAKVNTDTSTEKQYADDKLVDMAVSTGSTKLELEMRDLPMEILAELLGIEEKDGLYMFKKNIIPPWVAMTFYGPKANGKNRHVGLVKGRFSLPDEEWKTKEEKTDFQTVKLSAEFMEREQDEVFKVLADEDSPNFNLDKFYEKVFGDAYKSPNSGADSSSVDIGKTV